MPRDFDLGDYIQVPERLARFYELYPDGRVSSSAPVVVMIESGNVQQTYIQVTTTVYRTPDDPAPCQASAWELFPGKTPYTKESEMMNAETSAVGRALWAVGIEAKRGAASLEDVRNARAAQDQPAPAPSPEEEAARAEMNALVDLAAAVRKADEENGPYITAVRAEMNRFAQPPTYPENSKWVLEAWILNDPAEVRLFLQTQLDLMAAAAAQETAGEEPQQAPPPKQRRAKPGSAVEGES